MTEIKDPPIRKDKKCALPGCEEPLPEIAILNNDPFHSSACCRKWYKLDDDLLKEVEGKP